MQQLQKGKGLQDVLAQETAYSVIVCVCIVYNVC